MKGESLDARTLAPLLAGYIVSNRSYYSKISAEIINQLPLLAWEKPRTAVAMLNGKPLPDDE